MKYLLLYGLGNPTNFDIFSEPIGYTSNDVKAEQIIFLVHGKLIFWGTHAAVCTCDLVANQLTGLDLADATEQAAELLLGHVLGQVVDNEVGLAVVICWAGLHGRGAAAAVGGRPVGCGAASAGAVCHWSLHVTDDLEQRRRKEGEERRVKVQIGGRREMAFISKGFCWNTEYVARHTRL